MSRIWRLLGVLWLIGAVGAHAAPLAPPVAGTWSSDRGLLVLVHEGVPTHTVPVAGFVVSTHGDRLVLKGARFDPVASTLEFLGGGNLIQLTVSPDGKSLQSDLGLWYRDTPSEALTRGDRAYDYDIRFEEGAAFLPASSGQALLEIARVLREVPHNLRIEVYTGAADADKSLSQKRADVIKRYLVDEYRVDASRIDAVGCGGDNPIADDATDDGKLLNPRIELVKLP